MLHGLWYKGKINQRSGKVAGVSRCNLGDVGKEEKRKKHPRSSKESVYVLNKNIKKKKTLEVKAGQTSSYVGPTPGKPEVLLVFF